MTKSMVYHQPVHHRNKNVNLTVFPTVWKLKPWFGFSTMVGTSHSLVQHLNQVTTDTTNYIGGCDKSLTAMEMVHEIRQATNKFNVLHKLHAATPLAYNKVP